MYQTECTNGFSGKLHLFQIEGVKYALRAKRTFIADEMGLGKTVQAIATVFLGKSFPTIVVCPASLKLNWLREFKKWLPGVTVEIFSVTSEIQTDVVIINYDVVRNSSVLWRLKAKRFSSMILDESHLLKNEKSQRSQACMKLAQTIPTRLALTGTPILNRPIELLNQLKILGQINQFGGAWNFLQRYCDAKKNKWGWDFTGSSNLIELHKKLRETCYIRRRKDDVLAELPPKQYSGVNIELSNQVDYDRAENDLLGWLRENVSDEASCRASKAMQLVQIETLKKISAHGKIKGIVDWVNSFLESGEKLVLFGTHEDVIVEILNNFVDVSVSITGKTPVELRQGIVDQFQIDPKVKIIILNLKTGGTGLTLTAASNVAFCELGWNQAEHRQAEDRCHRIGQNSSVNVWYLLGSIQNRKTIDERIFTLLTEKEVVVSAVTDGDLSLQKSSILDGLLLEILC